MTLPPRPEHATVLLSASLQALGGVSTQSQFERGPVDQLRQRRAKRDHPTGWVFHSLVARLGRLSQSVRCHTIKREIGGIVHTLLDPPSKEAAFFRGLSAPAWQGIGFEGDVATQHLVRVIFAWCEVDVAAGPIRAAVHVVRVLSRGILSR